MILSAIVAVAENNAIGRDNQLPWHLPDDLKFFKRTTMGKPVLMGRKTYESLGKPLPGRLNIVISGQELRLPDGVMLCHSIEEGIALLEQDGKEEGFIIGGGKIFEETLNDLDRIYLTKVKTVVEDATAFFPEIDHAHWRISWEETHPADEKHAFPFVFQQLERIIL